MKNICFILVLFSARLFFAQERCDNLPKNYTGFCQEYHPNAQVSWLKEYKEGKATGVWMYFNEKGVLSKQLNTASKKDSLDQIYIINELADKPSPVTEEIVEIKVVESDIFAFVEEDAEFTGGASKMMEWVQANLVYPKEAEEKKLTGKCYVKFVVEKDGSISGVSIIKGVPNCPMCDDEVLRVIKAMPNWKPGKLKGKTVRSWCQIPFNFSLN